MNRSIAVLISVIIIVLIIITIKLLRHIIHRHFSDTITTTTTTSPLSSLPPPSPQPQINHSPPPQIRTHSPQPNPKSDQHNQDLINSLPTFRFESIKGIRESTSSLSSASTAATTTATLDCAICISRFEKQDQLRLLPSCCHVFHSVCIDQWILLSNYNCPICRSDVKLSVDGEDDDDGELKMISSSSRSFRIEIGSVSRSSRIEIGSFSASDLQNRSYSLGSFEYWVQDFDAEVFVELERINENRAQSDEVSVSAGGAAGGDEAAEIVIEDPVPAESDEAASYARSLSYSLQFSDRFYGGQRSGGGMDEGGGGGRVWDLEGNRFGEELSGFFGFLSRA
ncbi:E3 ubiquitin-protein ligase ATL4-like [Papaver somniferum]|uniref:E3 ubiquitin-protein ligase ATL4-like n=1 Tax=Papaver somniferum TaxID=3469 RepID=UPI000E6F7C38|nr:E3 ubiquitin-protein ligase ATL4-like [Papaver somniferum]